MNKRIKKKNNTVRINTMLIKAMDLVDEYMIVYARLVGQKNHHNANDDFWNEYDRWNKSIPARRVWKCILKKYGLSKYCGYKNKTIRT